MQAGLPVLGVEAPQTFSYSYAFLWPRLILSPRGLVRQIYYCRKTSPILKEVDRAAKTAGKNPRRRDLGFRTGKIARSMALVGSASLYPADGGKATIRVYRTALIGKTANKNFFDLLDESTGTYTRKFFAYAPPAIAGELHRQHSYRVSFNANPRHPRIKELAGEAPV